MTFKDPLVLFILPVLLIIFFASRRKRQESSFLFPSYDAIMPLKSSTRTFLSSNLIYFRLAAAILVIVALARPQTASPEKEKRNAIAIVLAVDCSSTMLAENLALGPEGLEKFYSESEKKRPTRLDAVKEMAKSFIKARRDDLIGVVGFGGEAYIVSPLTFDKEWLGQSIDRLKVGLMRDGTAIGSAIMSGLNSLKDTKAKGKVIMLFTDGINNAGEVPPLVAAKAARSLGVKIYTIGIASSGQTPYPSVDQYGKKAYKDVKIDINEDVLKNIAETTGGSYFRADDLSTLKESYSQIDSLEKASLEEKGFSENKDIFGYFIWAALALILAEMILGNTILRKIP